MPTPAPLRQLTNEIETDLDWRQAELAILREVLSDVAKHETRKRAMFRAGWALLYAHYEGFCKYCLEAYIDYLCRNLKNCEKMPDRTFIYFIDKEIRRTKSMSSEDVFDFFKTKIPLLKNDPPKKFEVNTKSNLWPDLLRDTLKKLDLQEYPIINDDRKIKTLVSRRNDIAHGKKVFIDDLTYYAEYEEVVLDVMYELALAVVDRSQQFTPSVAKAGPKLIADPA